MITLSPFAEDVSRSLTRFGSLSDYRNINFAVVGARFPLSSLECTEVPMRPTVIGLDIAKSVFQAHGVNAKGAVIIRKRLTRVEVKPFFRDLRPSLIGIEACGTSNYWARELSALGHNVKLVPTQYVKPYVKRSKTDALDAEAICEAVARPNMRFVPIKTPEAQAIGLLHGARSQLIDQRVNLMGSLRSGLAEFGIIAPRRRGGEAALLNVAAAGEEVPEVLKAAYKALSEAIRACMAQVAEIDLQIASIAKRNEVCARLRTIPGFGPVISTMLFASAGDFSRFRSARHFAAWLGLTPRQNSSGEAVKLGRITKAGDKTMRSLLVMGAITVIRRVRIDPKKLPWLAALLKRRPALVAAVAMANKMARIAWAIAVHGGTYRPATAG
jgi:transposase